MMEHNPFGQPVHNPPDDDIDLIDLGEFTDFRSPAAQITISRSPISGYTESELLRCVECAVCMKPMQHPKSLHCGHSFCTYCVDQISVRVIGPFGGVLRTSIKCPICQSTKDVPQTGLPTNYALRDAIEQMKHGMGMMGKCASCKQPSRELHICIDCAHRNERERICASCVLASHRIHTTKLVAETWSEEDIKSVIRDGKKIHRDFVEYCQEVESTVITGVNSMLGSYYPQEMAMVTDSETLRAEVTKGCLKRNMKAMVEGAKETTASAKKSIGTFLDDFNTLAKKHKHGA